MLNCLRIICGALPFFALLPSAYALTFPLNPDAQLTPGMLCEAPDAFRYAERIPYCNRHVTSEEKKKVFEAYRKKNWQIRDEDRRQFKIDHLIPLCAGGSNDRRNLWPQHQSVYEITDPLEPLVCEKMARGSLRQADAVELILRAKSSLEEVPQILAELQSL